MRIQSLPVLCAVYLASFGCAIDVVGEGTDRSEDAASSDPGEERTDDDALTGSAGEPMDGADAMGGSLGEEAQPDDVPPNGGASGPEGDDGSIASPASTMRLVPVSGLTSALVRLSDEERLVYVSDERGNVIPDFSSVGYEASARAIPHVSTAASVAPGLGDDSARIQKAIDDVSALPVGADGFRGAVELSAGTYEVGTTLVIKQNGVVLRGAGFGATVLLATGKTQRNAIEVRGQGLPKEVGGTRRAVIDDYVPVGSSSLHVEHTQGLSVGDHISVFREGTKEWIHDIGMDQIPEGDPEVKQWQEGEVDLEYERTITAIDGNLISIDAPMMMAIDRKYGGAFVYEIEFQGRIDHVGVEKLTLDSTYQLARETEDEAHAWTGVYIDAAEHAWVRDLSALHFGLSAVIVDRGARFVTVQDSEMNDPVSRIEGGRRAAFQLLGSRSLFQRLKATKGRTDFVTGARVAGPNVFADCVSVEAFDASGPRERWATGTLWDNVHARTLSVEDRSFLGTGHGWSGANQVFWNAEATTLTCQKPETAQNYCIGPIAAHGVGRFTRPDGYWESEGKHVSPRSLFFAQLEDRAGADAVRAVGVKAQYLP